MQCILNDLAVQRGNSTAYSALGNHMYSPGV